MTPKLPLSDRLRMVRVVPAYVLTMDEADSRFVEQAVREKEERDARREKDGEQNEQRGQGREQGRDWFGR